MDNYNYNYKYIYNYDYIIETTVWNIYVLVDQWQRNPWETYLLQRCQLP
jgi:hypothetical protein